MQLETAIIIRTRNEEKWIGEVLKRLNQQTYRDFEIVVVDSGSTDKTLNIVRTFPVKIVQIPAEKFTYPYAINVGIQNCQAEKYLVILSAHSLPIGDQWLEKGIAKFSLQENILGVYGRLKALPDGTFWDKIIHNGSYLLTTLQTPKRHKIMTEPGMGVLGFTNAIIRRDLWKQYTIDERYAGGGEDGAWAAYWMKRGYVAVMDLDFSVMHSHYLGLRGWIAQFKHWKQANEHKPFEYLSYRKDGAHNSS